MVTDRSADGVIVAGLVVEVLFPGFGSPPDEDATAVLTIVEPAGPDVTFATRLKTADAPDASAARLHVTVAPVVQVNVGPDVCAIEAKVRFGGSVSVRETDDAPEGPAFDTVIV